MLWNNLCSEKPKVTRNGRNPRPQPPLGHRLSQSLRLCSQQQAFTDVNILPDRREAPRDGDLALERVLTRDARQHPANYLARPAPRKHPVQMCVCVFFFYVFVWAGKDDGLTLNFQSNILFLAQALKFKFSDVAAVPFREGRVLCG